MKPDELMIGDWVLYRGDPIMIWEIDEYYDRVNTEPDGYNAITCIEISDINPIPLTPKILEKNGFKECTNGDWTNENVEFILYRRKDGIFRIQNTNMTLPYVSSFQHALRLCGINKKIEI